MPRKLFLLLYLSLLSSFIQAQSIKAKGSFVKDSIQIGEPLAYALSIEYPKQMEVVFPDSLYNFAPFELTQRRYFPTRSDSINSVDSAIYYLSTFEIDTVQYLKLPVFIVNEYDSTTLWTGVDSVILKQVVTAIPDSVAMKTNTEYVEVPFAFNYPYFTIGIGAVVLALVIGWILFGKSLRKKIKKYTLRKRHNKFVVEFDALTNNSFKDCEAILKLWKGYMESVSEHPYKKLTTKELIDILKDKTVEDALKNIDRNIYGPKDETLLAGSYEQIRETAVYSYHRKLEEVSNG